MAAMVMVFVAGTALAAALDELDVAGLLSRMRLGGLETLLREPYQDVTVLVAFSLVMLLLIWLVSGWSLAPLRRASAEAAAVGPANPKARISDIGLPSEVRPLVAACNGALARLAAAYALEQRFTADAAHELRTPLAVLGLRLQRARIEGRVDQAVETELAQMNRLVAQLLDLARKEQSGLVAGPITSGAAPGAGCTVNLSRAAREAAASVSLLAEAAGRALVVDLPHTLLVLGRADDLRDMVRNLLDNAVTHGAGRIRLTGRLEPAAASRSGASALLEVSDEGAGVPETLAPSLFERFRKAGSNSAGSGLGLAIVAEVIRSHGGNVGFAAAPDEADAPHGRGCRVWVRLPAVPAAAA